MNLHVADKDEGFFSKSRRFQIHIEMTVADVLCQNYHDENSLPFGTNRFFKGIFF